MALSDDEKKLLKDLKERAKLEAEINSGLKGYLENLEKVRDLNKDIKVATEAIAKANKTIADAVAAGDAAKEAQARAVKKVLEDQLTLLTEQKDRIVEIGKEAKRLKMTFAELSAGALKTTVKTLGNLPGIIANSTNKLKDLFEMDKSIKTSALQMGILSKQSIGFRDNIKSASMNTNALGVGLQELAQIQSQYSENLGRGVVMSQKSLEDIAAVAASTGLGAEGAAQMAADFDRVGMSASGVKTFLEDAMNTSHAMGLNASKVVKNIAMNQKMMNKYRFSAGAKGLAKMAMTATKLGVEMEFATGMADKMWDIEGAIDMSAQLQVMGGAFARLADPFKLMYMARNDIKGLTEELANAAKESMTFAKDGSIEMAADEMHRLKIIAQQAGLEYDDLVKAGQNALKLDKIKMQASGLDPELQEFIANTAEFKDGKATIMIGQDSKMVSRLNASDIKTLQAQQKEKESLEKRAKESQTFDDKLTNMINNFKVAMLPIVEGINSVLGPLADDLMGEKGKKFREELVSLGKTIGGFVETGAKIIKGVAEFAISLGPTGLFGLWVAGKVGGWLFEKASWILNGIALAEGFNIASAGGGLIKGLGTLTKTLAPIAGVAAATVGGGMFGKFLGKKATEASGRKSTKAGDNWGTGLAIAGGVLGLALAPFTGGASLAVTAAALGGTGALVGGLGGKYFGDMANQDEVTAPAEDTQSMGNKRLTNKAGYSENRAIVSPKGVTPIPNSESFVSMKPNGFFDNAMNGQKNNEPSKMDVEHSDMNVKGSININIPGTDAIALDIMKTTAFRTQIVSMVNSQLEINKNGKTAG
jgi:hypothetical protein